MDLILAGTADSSGCGSSGKTNYESLNGYATTGAVMADQTNTDIAALQTEVQQLRADIAKIAGTMRDIASNSVVEAGQQVQASTEKVWTEVKRQAGSVGREIEDRPVAAALTAFGAGVLLGLLLNGRRG